MLEKFEGSPGTLVFVGFHVLENLTLGLWDGCHVIKLRSYLLLTWESFHKSFGPVFAFCAWLCKHGMLLGC